MILEYNLKNDMKYKLPKKPKHLLLFGPNRIGKTMIANAIIKENSTDEAMYLLFDKNIMENNFVGKDGDEGYNVSPYINEKIELDKKMSKVVEILNLKKLLKDNYNETAKVAYTHFPNVIKLFSKEYEKEILKITDSKFEAYFYKDDNIEFPSDITYYFDDDFLKLILDSKKIKTRFIDFIIELNKEKIFEKINEINDIYKGISREEFYCKDMIVKNNLEECNVCHSIISSENRIRIINDLNRIILNEDLKKKLNYYIENNEKVFDIINELIINFEEQFEFLLKRIDLSIINNLYNVIDKTSYQILLDIYDEFLSLNEKKINFNVKQEKEGSYIHQKIDKYFEKFSKLTNSKVYFKINEGSINFSFDDNEKNRVFSQSEQKLLEFIYFKILFLQYCEQNRKIVALLDDPFDSYDDIFVYDMVTIIYDLISEHSANIKRFIVFSHNMNSLNLLKDLFLSKGEKFEFNWLDIFREDNNNEICNIKDRFEVMSTVDRCISTFGLPLKIKNKMKDEYSIIVFSAIMRDNCKLMADFNKKPNRSLKPFYSINKNYYNLISEGINHRRISLSINKLFKLNVNAFSFTNLKIKNKSVEDCFKKLPSNYFDLELISINNKNKESLIKDKDLLNLLIWKYMVALKIRRELEYKMWIHLGKIKYRELSDLFNKLILIDETHKLVEFYKNYKQLFNSFNHCTSCNIPPFLLYNSKYLQEALFEVESII